MKSITVAGILKPETNCLYNIGCHLRPVFLLMCILLSCPCAGFAQTNSPPLWGDQGNGTFKNPVINADYSDPDVIKVGDSFYMVCSDFHYMGMPVLKSKDLVNWTIIGKIYNRLDINSKYNTMERYGGGSWAPSIRFHDGRFFVYFCTPDEGLYMSTTADPSGKWSALTEIKKVGGWEDPCPFWDDNGQAYLGHSRLGAGPIIIHKMSKDGKHLLDSGKVVYEGPTSEGTKIYKRKGFYYIIIPEGGVGTGYETALRSKNIYGPYERKIVLEQGTTSVNGPHQGGFVELPSGESWFMHFQGVGALGRVCHLEPVSWIDDWPLMGIDIDKNGIGEPVSILQKPNIKTSGPILHIQTSDEFNKKDLGLQWQWNHNPVDSNWSLTRNSGYLSLKAMPALKNKEARNTLTQKLMGNSGTVTTMLNTSQMNVGQRAGLCLFGQNIHEVGVMKTDSGLYLYADNNGQRVTGEKVNGNRVFLRLRLDLLANHNFLEYSFDNNKFYKLGLECELSGNNYWKGARPALFSYNITGNSGTALFNWFHYVHDGPNDPE